jgi:uncharacterized Zn finger protein
MTTATITATTLAKVDSKRFDKATTALRNGEYTITVTYVDHNMIRAYVQNGDGQQYGVALFEGGASCSCKDAMYRGGICKHSVALAIKVLQDGVEMPAVSVPNLTLKKMSPAFDTSMI